jgi:endonuclease III
MSAETMPFSPLVAEVISASMAHTHAVTNALIESLTERAETAEAELDAIRSQVHQLLSGEYMPTPNAIQRALYPDEATVAAFREEAGR